MNTRSIGVLKKGQVNKTKKQRKKHIEQMSIKEVRTIQRGITSLQSVSLSHHMVEKVKRGELVFEPSLMIETLENASSETIIEYNRTTKYGRTSRRVLLRSTRADDVLIGNDIKKCNLCFVISLNSGTIITAYWNEANDNHNSINWSRYDKDLRVR